VYVFLCLHRGEGELLCFARGEVEREVAREVMVGIGDGNYRLVAPFEIVC
jgi:hypothetical protein